MSQIAVPHTENGTHVIPVEQVRCPHSPQLEGGTGEIRWSLKGGLRFRVRFHGRMAPPDAAFAESSGGIGNPREVSLRPEWTCKTREGLDVLIFGLNPEVKSETTNTNGVIQSSFSVSGKCVAASVELQQHCPISFWHDSEQGSDGPGERFLIHGLHIIKWPETRRKTYNTPNGTTERGYARLPLGGPENTVLAQATVDDERNAIWILPHTVTPAQGFRIPRLVHDARGFLSFLVGGLTPVCWRDQFTRQGHLTRTYYGYERARSRNGRILPPIPISGVEGFKHGEAIAAALPRMFAHYREIKGLPLILSMLHLAHDAYLDDQLTLASVALERLLKVCEEQVGPPPPAMAKEECGTLRDTLLACFEEFQKDRCIDRTVEDTIRKNLSNCTRPTNPDKYKAIFRAMGIELSSDEWNVVKQRNKCLHGVPTFPLSNHNIKDFWTELRNYHTMVVLIHKAILSMLTYEDLYINYAAYPSSGNAPLAILGKKQQGA